LNIITYLIDNLKNIEIEKLYIQYISCGNYGVVKYLENNYEIDKKLLSIGGNIDFWKKSIGQIHLVNIEDINHILLRNSEEEIIELFKTFNKFTTLDDILEKNYILEKCIINGYLKLSMFIMNEYMYTKISDNIENFAKYSKCDDDVLEFTKFLKDKKYNLNNELIINYSIINGNLKTLKYLYDKELFNINIAKYINDSIINDNFEVFKYLINLKQQNDYDINDFF